MLYLSPTSVAMAKQLGIDALAAETATEDTLRAGPHAPLAQLLAGAEPAITAALGMSAWRVISPGVFKPVGFVRQFASLRDALAETFDENTVLLVDEVCIPKLAIAVLTVVML